MAIQAKRQDIQELSSMSHALRGQVKPASGFHFGLGQVVLLWGIVAIAMAAVFFFGLALGREQGFRQALEERGQLAVRIPVDQLFTAHEDNVESLVKGENAEKTTTPVGQVGTSATKQQTAASLERGGSRGVKTGDFKNTAKKKPIAGFLSRPAKAPELKEKTGSSKLVKLTAKLGNVEVMTVAKAKKKKLAAKSILSVAAPVGPVASPLSTKSSTAKVSKAVTKNKTLKSFAVRKNSIKMGKLRRGWFIQVSAARNRKEAQALVRKLKITGYSAQIEKTVIKKTKFYRVLVGPYAAHRAANSALKSLKKKPMFSETPFLKQIR